MATKEEKLAAARKKLKEYQGKNKDVAAMRTSTTNFKQNVFEQLITKQNERREEDASSVTSRSSTEKDRGSLLPSPASFLISSDANNVCIDNSLPLASSYFTTNNSMDNSYNSLIFENISCSVEEQVQPTSASNSVKEQEWNGNSSLSNTESPNIFRKTSLVEDIVQDNSTETALSNILEPLQLQLHSHVQTISALMSERNELSFNSRQAETLLQEKNGEIQELHNRLSAANNEINKLEQSYKNTDNIITSLRRDNAALHNSLDQQLTDKQQLLEKYDVKDQEYSEIKQKLIQKSEENENILTALHNTNNQLSLCQIKIQQLTSTTPDVVGSQLVTLLNEKTELASRVNELEQQLQSAVSDNEQSNQNFQVYAQQCNNQLQNVKEKISLLEGENKSLKNENELLNIKLKELSEETESKLKLSSQHDSELCKQQELIKQLQEENNKLKTDIVSQCAEGDKLKSDVEELSLLLEEKEKNLRDVEAACEHLVPESQVNSANEKLLAAMESDKVAAARAVAQNVKLKQQLIELQDGFVKMSVGKLEVTEKLEHAEHVNQQLLLQLQTLEKKSECSDHHDHDHNHEHHHHSDNDDFYSNNVEELKTVIHQLENDKVELMNRISQLMSTTSNKNNLSFLHQPQHDHSEHEHSHHDHSEHEHNCSEPPEDPLVLSKMEEKLKRTMDEIAKLDEEKQRLEHLVLQLQEETETIGEYVTLYQRQRMLLKQRAKEKDEQLIQVSQDREELKSKLAALDLLVQGLLKGKQQQDTEYNNAAVEKSDDTAVKIRELITEIGSTNLVNMMPVSFEHCHCCSGRLITI